MKKITLFALLLLSTQAYRSQAQCSTSSTPGSYCGSGDAIDAFSLAGVPTTGNSGCSNSSGYIFFNAPVRTLTIGQTYPWTATVGGSSWTEGFAIWIDLNNNGQFESTEQLASTPAAYSHSGTITIPSTATPGTNIKMRTRCQYATQMLATDACTTLSWGETEDYNVTLASACPLPTVSAQPQNRTTCEGQNVQFSVTATSAASYQWQVNPGTGWSNVAGANYSGATANTLAITNVTIAFNTRQYRCIVTGNCSNPVTSAVATLTVNAGPSITSQTLADTICHNAITSLNVNTAGTISAYQWEMAIATVGIFSPVPNQYPFSGANTKTLTIVPVPDTLNDYIFRCAVIGGQCPNLNSAPIPMNVIESPVFIEDPQDQHIQPTADALFTAKGTQGMAIVYYWQASADGINYSNIYDNALYAKTKTPELLVKAAPLSMANWHFRCIIKSADPQCGLYYDTSKSAQLKMVILPSGVNELASEQSEIVVYPNPATGGELFISTTAKIEGALRATVIDKLGRVLYSSDINLSNSNKAATIDVSHLTPGVYNLQLTNAEGTLNSTTTFTKQ
ncbi:GEVED domain-containing protein [Polluticoccus soli]|uniref:GEVED domain-containing protein n=1 Tax=Polluticoccus soli TaxID=3034150 RepID=UPI0023E20F6A|nr:GEVED domain-containing protein [Flavipsychrobacter sp. JY13-12]